MPNWTSPLIIILCSLRCLSLLFFRLSLLFFLLFFLLWSNILERFRMEELPLMTVLTVHSAGARAELGVFKELTQDLLPVFASCSPAPLALFRLRAPLSFRLVSLSLAPSLLLSAGFLEVGGVVRETTF